MRIRAARLDDGGQLLPLIHAHAAFERSAASLTAPALDDLLRQSERPVHLFVAELDNLLGYAALTFDYALWQGARTGNLDCLFVAESSRGLGLGGHLLQAVAEAARQAGAIRLEWQTPRWNAAAIGFYQKFGVAGEGAFSFFL
ncbi:GNAT family N-acetyltransferase [Falsirhodobacter deserti]|uniref:GNAT family N-acetyltransferase n=1 Tax=Falsirhodobacter deserti TaxID=1365611 RepID=UPI000FE2BB5D|nr:GNAT family N-acetyltransferase [Falsirhodobacter deserti]